MHVHNRCGDAHVCKVVDQVKYIQIQTKKNSLREELGPDDEVHLFKLQLSYD